MIEKVIEQTNLYIENMCKKERKKYGQFFTSKETALFMAKLFQISDNVEKISVLDPGAGSGILSCAFVDVLQNRKNLKLIEVTCYENDEKILDLLKRNLDYIKEKSKIKIEYKIISENYITSQYFGVNHMLGESEEQKKYDVVIGNPPYMKISKDAPEAIAMSSICYGTPNLYFLFTAMSLFNLKEGGQLVYIIPRSWTSGAYFKKFREYLFSVGIIEHIHLFVSRSKVFDKEEVLQETIIIKVKKNNGIVNYENNIVITSSESNNDFNEITQLKVPYNIVVEGPEKYVYLVTNEYEINVLKKINKFKENLPSIGLKMKTGLIVDFRSKDVLRNEEEKESIPLFYSQHIKDGLINFPIDKENQYIVTDKKGLIQENKNYLFVKRFTAKEEKRRLQCGIYLAKNFPKYKNISTQNKINFITGIKKELSECTVYGLYALFNSTLFDVYYRILNGSTQVNSTEVNSIPVPEIGIIKEIGTKLIRSKDLSEENCNNILEEYYV